jgi:predicted membrane channel-forming protein YqfA (hemolysin III family)
MNIREKEKGFNQFKKAAVTLMKHFRTPAYRWVRTSLFLALGLFAVFPTTHQIYVYGVKYLHGLR